MSLIAANQLSMLDVKFVEQTSHQDRIYTENEEEASLTQIVIAQIEHDNNQRNKNAIKLSKEANEKNSLDKNRHLSKSNSIDIESSKNEEQTNIKLKLNVPFHLTNSEQEQQTCGDPIYDVPQSKSLANINTGANEEISLKNQHHIHMDNDFTYFYTSSPNIFINVYREEPIYDTPSTRSLAI